MTSQSCDLPVATPEPRGRAGGEPTLLGGSLAMGGEDSPVSVTGLTLEADSAGAKVSTDTGVQELSLYFVWAFYF